MSALELAEVAGVRNWILPNTQSIDGLKRVSQLCPRTTAQEESRVVTKKSTERVSPDGNRSGIVVL